MFIFRTHAAGQKDYFQYYSYGATITEVELDVLTGEQQIDRVDILFDCGERWAEIEVLIEQHCIFYH